MPKFVIERELPGAGKLSAQELRAISEKSVGILNTLGPKIQWVHSYVADDKIYCVYNAPSPELIQRTPISEDWRKLVAHPGIDIGYGTLLAQKSDIDTEFHRHGAAVFRSSHLETQPGANAPVTQRSPDADGSAPHRRGV